MQRTGQKHLIQCRCILPQFQKLKNPPLHKFIVFSELSDDGVITKLAQCNNCGVIHRVVDVCKSDIVVGKEHASSILSIDDIRTNIPETLQTILDAHDADLATWEATKFIIDAERWGDFVVLTSDNVENMRQGKYIRILGKTLFKVDSFSTDDVISFV